MVQKSPQKMRAFLFFTETIFYRSNPTLSVVNLPISGPKKVSLWTTSVTLSIDKPTDIPSTASILHLPFTPRVKNDGMRPEVPANPSAKYES